MPVKTNILPVKELKSINLSHCTLGLLGINLAMLTTECGALNVCILNHLLPRNFT